MRAVIFFFAAMLVATTIYAGNGDFFVDGSLGIGTTTPSFPLSIYGTNTSTDKRIRLENSAITDLISYGSAQTNTNLAGRSALVAQSSDLILMANGAYSMSFYTGGYNAANERMRILGNGNIGIGTTTPSQMLEVKGNAYLNNSTSSYLIINRPNNSTTDSAVLFKTASTSKWVLGQMVTGSGGVSNQDYFSLARFTGSAYSNVLTADNSGNVGIGTTSPKASLDLSLYYWRLLALSSPDRVEEGNSSAKAL